MATVTSPAGQAAETSVDPNPAFQRPPVGAPGGPPIPPTVPVTVDEYKRLRDIEQQLNEFQRTQQAALEAKEAERIKALAEKGQIEEALNQTRASWEQKHNDALSRYTQLEKQVFAERRDSVISSAFRGRQFVGQTPDQQASTASMLQRLIEDKFETTRDGASGALVVREKGTGRPAADVLKSLLDSPEYALFFMPTTRGGSGSDAFRAPAPPPNAPPQPGSLEAIAAQMREKQGQYQAFGFSRRRPN